MAWSGDLDSIVVFGFDVVQLYGVLGVQCCHQRLVQRNYVVVEGVSPGKKHVAQLCVKQIHRSRIRSLVARTCRVLVRIGVGHNMMRDGDGNVQGKIVAREGNCIV